MSIQISNLVKEYGLQKAVDGVSFEAKRGEVLGFLGPNGAGKSTTMKVATCYLPPTNGTVLVNGLDVTTSPRQVRKVVGYLPEHNPLYLDMYVHEYLRFIGGLHGMRGGFLKRKVDETVGRVGLEREQKKLIGSLSKGYRQRVGLAQAILHEPDVLILDEPTTGLDPNQILEIRNLIKQESKNKTVVLSTHIMQEVQALCDRVIIINRGKIVANDKVESLQNLGQKATISIELEHPIDSAESLLAIKGVSSASLQMPNRLDVISDSESDIRGDIFRHAVDSGWVILEMTKENQSLENVFQELTKPDQG